MGSCGANRREIEDQSAIKGKFDQIRPILGSLIWAFGEQNVKERRREKGREKEREEEEEEVEERYGNYVWMGMILYGNYVWMARILYGFVWKLFVYGLLWVCMDIILFYF